MKAKVIYLVVGIVLLSASCDKHNDEKDFVGKWELTSVSYSDSMRSCGQPHIDYPKTAVYDFQKNGKLVITYVISGELQQSEHSYKCVGTTPHPLVDDFSKKEVKDDPHTHLIQIDGQDYTCVISDDWVMGNTKYKKDGKRMWIFYFRKKDNKTLDDADLVMMENDDVHYWDKDFVKLK